MVNNAYIEQPDFTLTFESTGDRDVSMSKTWQGGSPLVPTTN